MLILSLHSLFFFYNFQVVAGTEVADDQQSEEGEDDHHDADRVVPGQFLPLLLL